MIFGITKATDVPCDSYTENFLNDVRIFKWNINRDSKEIIYRDLTGPEKVRLHKSINIPVLFPGLNKKEQHGRLWSDFFTDQYY